MIKSFRDFEMNESLGDLFRDDRTDEERFYDSVKSNLIDIVMQEQQISEKSFGQCDVVMAECKKLMAKDSEVYVKLNEMMADTTDARPQYWAERLYQEVLNRKKFNTDLPSL